MNLFNIEFFEDAEIFIKSLPDIDRSKVMATISIMRTDFISVNTKLLKSPIKELKIKKYRLLFFIDKTTIYFISGFIKKRQKAPLQEIKNAEEIYKQYKPSH